MYDQFGHAGVDPQGMGGGGQGFGGNAGFGGVYTALSRYLSRFLSRLSLSFSLFCFVFDTAVLSYFLSAPPGKEVLLLLLLEFHLPHPLSLTLSTGMNPEDIFSEFFGQRGGQGGPPRPTRGSDLQVRLRLAFMEAVHGCSKPVTVTTTDGCGTCEGTGSAPGTVNPNPTAR